MAVFILCGRSNGYINDNTFKSIIMNWYIGQEVLALNNKGPLKQGKIYKIMGLEKAWCGCGHINIHVGIFMNGSRSCGECGSVQNKDVPEWWFHEKRFVPLDKLMAEQIEEFKLELSL